MAIKSGHVVPLREFSPTPTDDFSIPLRSRLAPGSLFFSPAMQSNNGAQIDVSSVSWVSRVADTYRAPLSQRSVFPFLLGPAPAMPSGRAWPPDFSASYEPVLNDGRFGLVNNEASGADAAIRGVLYNTTTFETTIILV
jgi:hypothetical protein